MNVGSTEGIIRFAIGFMLLVTAVDLFAFLGPSALLLVSILTVLAAILALTAISHTCPIYGIWNKFHTQ